MLLKVLKSKIHRAVVTEADLNYVGSITIDSGLMQAAGIVPYEMVQVVDVSNGQRFETYAIPGEAESGTICVNGAAARLVSRSDIVIIMAYASMTPEEAEENKPAVVITDRENKIKEIRNYIKAGEVWN